MTRQAFLLILMGAASWVAYIAVNGLGDLRKNTIGFEIIYLAAFALYLAAAALLIKGESSRLALVVVIGFAILFRLVLLPTRPTLSDDMYRYVWDGRVQAHGLSPYRYPPNAAELANLRQGDTTIWRYINRRPVVTVYPPGAQMAYALIWRIVGDSTTGFKAAFALAELVGAWLLLQLLKAFGLPPQRLVIYLWSPLLVFEVAHAGHVDGLMLPALILAFWARVKNRPWLLGAALGAATLIKLFPIILLLALLPVESTGSLPIKLRPALKTLAAFLAVMVLGYALYSFGSASALGFLPNYFGENFNMGLARFIFDLAKANHWPASTVANLVTFGGLAGLSLLFLFKPAASPRESLTRCAWLMGWFTITTQNLFPWYLLWLLPLIVLFVEPGNLLGFKLAPMTAWLVFSGAVTFSYLFFLKWRIIPWAQAAEYWPLYGILLASAAWNQAPIALQSRLRLRRLPTL